MADILFLFLWPLFMKYRKIFGKRMVERKKEIHECITMVFREKK